MNGRTDDGEDKKRGKSDACISLSELWLDCGLGVVWFGESGM